MTDIDKKGLQALCRALKVLNHDNRRMPLCVYRVMAALGEAGEPCGAYAVARRAGFLLEHGRVKLHEAKRLGVVANVHVEGQGVLWALTERGRAELARVLAELKRVDGGGKAGPMAADREAPKAEAAPLLPGLAARKGGRRRRS